MCKFTALEIQIILGFKSTTGRWVQNNTLDGTVERLGLCVKCHGLLVYAQILHTLQLKTSSEGYVQRHLIQNIIKKEMTS